MPSFSSATDPSAPSASMADFDEVSDERKVEIASRFLLHAPPGEFNEVFNDVRVMLGDDHLLKEKCAGAFAQYNKDQFTPVRIDGSDMPTIICEQNEHNANSSTYHDPRSKQLFHFDHVRREASDCRPTTSSDPSSARLESWRSALEACCTVYVKNHFKYGVCAVFAKLQAQTDVATGSSEEKLVLTVCIEGHQFQSKNFWNGRLRSQWRVCFSPASAAADIQGVIRVQVHYYEDGNVQLVSTRQMRESCAVSNEADTARAIVAVISDAENEYQRGVNENYNAMSETTFKALRRQLPVTRSKIDWGKIAGYKIGSELRQSDTLGESAAPSITSIHISK